MKNYNESVRVNHNSNWPSILDHPIKVFIIGGSGPGKTNELLNLIKHQPPDIYKVYLYVKDPFESKYHLLIKTSRSSLSLQLADLLSLFIRKRITRN